MVTKDTRTDTWTDVGIPEVTTVTRDTAADPSPAEEMTRCTRDGQMSSTEADRGEGGVASPAKVVAVASTINEVLLVVVIVMSG